ncbi:hypothetical protein [Pedobacter sp. Leaf194]|uniref:hypothetical protein n=1 Tax=Pedobacter sp. Leaf194 TaxID=1736297 RepID=UPI0007039EC7|nr:hypothetical protein [Pedobacter sp. Leaf194]KQS41000.1 hypothetical protein ASG14_00480 [Pedobacter sp. Leaf194]
MKTIEQSLDNFGEILEALATQSKALEDNVRTLINTKPADYGDDFKKVLQELTDVNGKLDREDLKAMLVSLNRKIEKVPDIIPVKHHHYLDKSSKGLVIGIFTGLLFIAVLTGLSAYILNRNASLALDSDKLLYLRAYNPEYLMRIDLGFVSSRDSLVRVAKEIILNQEQLLQAEQTLRNKEVELNKARLLKKKIEQRRQKK